MSKVSLIFPGQGAQYVGMAKEELKPYFDQASEALGFDLTHLCQSGPEEELKLTKWTQPAIVTHSYALFKKLEKTLEEQNIKIDKVLGHSVGEYSALSAAGAIDFSDAVKAVHHRGMYMQEATPVGVGKMYAILRAPMEDVVAACEAVSKDGHIVSAANFNEPTQTVISGHADACDEVAQKLTSAEGSRVRAVELAVSAPFHCELMRPAAQKLDQFMQSITFNPLKFPYIANINAREYATDTQIETIKSNLIDQVCGSVRWTQSLSQFADGSKFIEVGPGNVLKGLARKINKSFKVLSLDKVEDWNELESFLKD